MFKYLHIYCFCIKYIQDSAEDTTQPYNYTKYLIHKLMGITHPGQRVGNLIGSSMKPGFWVKCQ